MEERLQKIVRDLTGISRRDAEELIRRGKVTVNGVTAQIGDKATKNDKITVNNKVFYPETKKVPHRYYLVYKPVGYTCSNEDMYAKKLVTSLVPNGSRLHIAGRLDVDSEGLVILTTDGDFVFKLTHPRFEVQKVYDVEIEGHLNDKQVDRMKGGVEVEGITYTAKSAKVIHYTRSNQVVRITLTEGKKREIREMMKFMGKNIITLKRIAIGPFFIGDLKAGDFKVMKPGDVATAMRV